MAFGEHTFRQYDTDVRVFYEPMQFQIIPIGSNLIQVSRRSLVGSDVRSEFKSQVGHQNENMKIFLRRLTLRRFLTKLCE